MHYPPRLDREVTTKLNHINESCQNKAVDSRSQAIDDSIILFKSHSSLTQYMSLKIKRGYKVCCRCDSQSGYLYEIDIYTDKTENTFEEELGAKVIKKLIQKHITKGMQNSHITFCDFKILAYWFDNDIYVTGTVRRLRADVPDLVKGATEKKLKLPKRNFEWRVKENVALIILQDNKEVLFMTNAIYPKLCRTTVTRMKKMDLNKMFGAPLLQRKPPKEWKGWIGLID
ncbi:unnamed protein product [Parnassius mnemosyne]|uniref:PiggyBac transposable element-derived protein domain-containing protein n=1 Tax=Parnassius mnemosyne TaxID=213953 RepID=A0AAV1KG46_9NEOP